jgi:hypothetical protein
MGKLVLPVHLLPAWLETFARHVRLKEFAMIETNTRIVAPGPNFFLWVRRAKVTGSHVDPDLLQRACNQLQYAHGLAAVPLPVEQSSLLVVTFDPVPTISVEEEKREIKVEDAGEPSFRLRLTDKRGKRLIPTLVERALIAQVARKTKLWRLDSWRIWYEPEPFHVEDGIAAYRRYEISTSPIDKVGVGITIGVSTAFFTANNLTYYLDPSLPPEQRDYRRKLFERLTQRQQNNKQKQKGTLLYNNGSYRGKCYFVDAPEGMTCKTSGVVRDRSQSYDSLLEYYTQNNPSLKAKGTDQAVKVSFVGIDSPQPVAAKLLYVRVMNDNLPERMKSLDKLSPELRSNMATKFWELVGTRPLGRVIPGLIEGFWQPNDDYVRQMEMPEITFGKGKCLPKPEATESAYADNYRKRLKYLEDAGCYYVPATMERTLYYAFPKTVSEETRKKLMDDLTHKIFKLANRPLGTSVPIVYDSISDAIIQLRAHDPGAVVFVLNDEANAYHEVAFQLDRWRVKRMTSRVLSDKYQRLQNASSVGQKNSKPDKSKKRWDDFIVENALDVLQLLDVIPFRVDKLGPYEAMLVIDVGQDRRYQALSLLIMREKGQMPEHGIVRHVHVKPDINSEAINPKLLADQMVELVNALIRNNRDPLKSLLIIRDGKTCDKEPEGIADGITQLKNAGKLATDARVDEVDLRKDTLKHSRFWETDGSTPRNPLEGKLIRQDENTVLLATTGGATLHQGTANPITLVNNGRCSNLLDAAQAIFAACQLNLSSPRVAQRLPLPLKITDEELDARSAQEIRRIR